MPWMRVTGNKGIPYGGLSRERGRQIIIDSSDFKGTEMVHFERVIFFRTGQESLVPAPDRSKCAAEPHKLKMGELVYYLGENPLHPGINIYACQNHVRMIPTETHATDEFRKSWYTNVEIKKL